MDTGLTTIRVVPLLLTGDMKAHGEVGLVSVSGYSGCRRCTVKGEYLQNHCRYGSFRYRYKHPSLPKTAEQNRQYGKKVDSIDEGNVKNELKHNYGVTGESPFYVLYDLCGFDPVKDAVIDVMHVLPLNLIKTELQRILAPLKDNTN